MSGKAKSEAGGDYWPGFVDALSAILMIMVFLVSLLVLVQFFTSQELAGKDKLLERLRQRVAGLSVLLNLEQNQSRNLEAQIYDIEDTLSATKRESADIADLIEEDEDEDDTETIRLRRSVLEEKRLSAEAEAQLELFIRQVASLRRQIAELQRLLDAKDESIRESDADLADLGRRLNAALAQKLQELAKARSDFFARLRRILGNREGFEIVGDRFRLQSEVLFAPGSASLSQEGQFEIAQLASVVKEVAAEIPDDVPWLLRVDGHTDRDPINTTQFPSNWHLGGSRAISVIQAMRENGVSPVRLMAASFAENQPVDLRFSREAYKNNRRIEFKITQR